MSTKLNGGPAFPHAVQKLNSNYSVDVPGMTLRDYFAAQALTAYIIGNNEEQWGNIESIAIRSYAAADTMLKERTR